MNPISFFIPITPPKTTSQTKRLVMIGGKPRFFHKKEHQQAEGDLMVLMARYAPPEPYFGPLALRIEFVFPWRKQESKRRMAWGKLPNDTRPDLDNQEKLVCDVMTKLRFYNDDGQIADKHTAKFWGDKVGITVHLSSIESGLPSLYPSLP